jgi:hypothetical protein
MSKRINRVITLVAPLLVGVLNVTHPMFNPPVYAGIIHHLSWWIRLHLLNLFLFPLIGLAAFLLVKDAHNLAATVAKLALAIFIPIYAAFDALAGIGTGILVQSAQRLTPGNLTTVGPLIDSYWSSGLIYAIAATGSIAWVIAMLSTAVALNNPERRRAAAILAVVLFLVGGWARANLFPMSSDMRIPVTWWLITIGMGFAMFLIAKPHVPAALLVLSGALFGASHVYPTGPLGMLCFLGGAISVMWVAPAQESFPKRLTDTQSSIGNRQSSMSRASTTSR